MVDATAATRGPLGVSSPAGPARYRYKMAKKYDTYVKTNNNNNLSTTITQEQHRNTNPTLAKQTHQE